jgi:hypothetical protein
MKRSLAVLVLAGAGSALHELLVRHMVEARLAGALLSPGLHLDLEALAVALAVLGLRLLWIFVVPALVAYTLVALVERLLARRAEK